MLSRVVARMLPYFPRSLVGAVARKYIAGDDLPAAQAKVDELVAEGFCATVDVLGEDVQTADEADQTVRLYLELLDAVTRWDKGHDAVGISCKPTQFGLRCDPSGTRERLAEVARVAVERGVFMRLDMEDSSITDPILELYRELHAKYPRQVGCVLQAMLFRTRDDTATLLAEPSHDVRLCKGIYKEPAELAWQGRKGVRENFLELGKQMLDAGLRVRMATHDLWLIERLRAYVEERAIDPATVEFQALLGVPVLKTLGALRDAGFPVRLYVPYGGSWYAYSLRRLRENPKVAGQVMRGMFSRQK